MSISNITQTLTQSLTSSLKSTSDSSSTSSLHKPPSKEEMFKKMDTNGDGKLDKVELSDVAKHMSEMSGTDVSADSLIAAGDSDGDGELSASEMDTVMESMRPQGPPPQGAMGGTDESGSSTTTTASSSSSSSSKTYDKLDTNKDGVVSEAERAAAQTDLSSLLLNSVAGIESEE